MDVRIMKNIYIYYKIIKLYIMSKEDDIIWTITEPVSTAVIEVDDEYLPVPKEILNKKKNVKPGDRIVLVKARIGEITAPAYGSTVKSLLMSIERGMDKYITESTDSKIVYDAIMMFRLDYVTKLLKKYKNGKLKPSDLVGDHYFFGGGLRRKNGIWTYYT
jgi:hypothetical protein